MVSFNTQCFVESSSMFCRIQLNFLKAILIAHFYDLQEAVLFDYMNCCLFDMKVPAVSFDRLRHAWSVSQKTIHCIDFQKHFAIRKAILL